VTKDSENQKITYRIREISEPQLDGASEESVESDQTQDSGQENSRSDGIYAVNFLLDKSISWDAFVASGVLSGRLNFEDLLLSKLHIEMGAGNLEILVGDITETCEIKIMSAASKVDLVIPEDIGVKIVQNGFLTKVNFVGESITEDKTIMSKNYDSADKKLTLYISNALGQFEIIQKSSD